MALQILATNQLLHKQRDIRFQSGCPSDGFFILGTLGRLVSLQVINNRLSVLSGRLGDAGLAQGTVLLVMSHIGDSDSRLVGALLVERVLGHCGE